MRVRFFTQRTDDTNKEKDSLLAMGFDSKYVMLQASGMSSLQRQKNEKLYEGLKEITSL